MLKNVLAITFLVLLLSFCSAELDVGIDGEIGIDLGVTPLPITNATYVTNNYTYNGSTLYLNNITDVEVPTPSDGDSLIWNSSLSRWIASAISSSSRWIIDYSTGYFYNSSDTIYFNESKLNNTIDDRIPAASKSVTFYEYLTSSRYETVTENLNESGIPTTVYEEVQPGDHYVYGSELI